MAPATVVPLADQSVTLGRAGYIPRLRGFIGAPDTLIYYHNSRWSSSRDVNRRPQPRHSGRNYMDEDPDMWTTTTGKGAEASLWRIGREGARARLGL